MYDGLSANFKGCKIEWVNNPELEFKPDAKYKWNRKAEYNGLCFTYNANTSKVNGSLHKFWNSGKHNWNDFYISDFLDVVSTLFDGFEINPLLWQVHSIEYGVNVSLPMPAKTFIKRFVMGHKNKYKPNAETFKGKGYMLEFDYDNYKIKIYDKALQYNKKGNILRFEVKVDKIEHLKKYGIDQPLLLSDLFNSNVLSVFSRVLLNTFDEIVIVDPGFKGRKSIANYLKSNGKNTTYYRKIENLTEQAYQFSSIKAVIRELIASKTRLLTTTDNHFQNKLIPLLSEWKNSIISPDKDNDNLINELAKMGKINTIYKGVNSYQTERRYCQTCGRDITHQKSNSKFCSALYVGETTAKACRNGDSNPRNYIKRRIKELTENSLFDTLPFIIPSKLAVLDNHLN